MTERSDREPQLAVAERGVRGAAPIYKLEELSWKQLEKLDRARALVLLPASPLVLLSTVSLAFLAEAATNKTLNVSFNEAPNHSSVNVVQDNFLGISWELFPLNYLCKFCFDKVVCHPS